MSLAFVRPALPLHTAGPYVAAAYIVFVLVILIYVAIMAVRLTRASARPSSCEPAPGALGRGDDVRVCSMFAPVCLVGWMKLECPIRVFEFA